MWGSIVGACRSFARLAFVHIDEDRYGQISSLLLLFCISLRQHLRGESNLSEYTQHVIKVKYFRLSNSHFAFIY